MDSTAFSLLFSSSYQDGKQKRGGKVPPKLRNHVTWIVFAIAVSFLLHLAFVFQNVADLKFFAGVSFPFDVWFAFNDTPDSFLTHDCDDLQAATKSQVPILFKRCIPVGFSLSDFAFFQNSSQNIFPACEGKVTRDFEFEAFDKSKTAIIEDVPCAATTLAEKLGSFHKHNITENSSYFEVHTYMMNDPEIEHVVQYMKGKGVVTADFELEGRPVILTYFLHAGTTAVYYLHSHMDQFFSFNLKEAKTWELVNPKYHDMFTYTWSGNANMILREHQEAPRVFVKQERGDILYIPPWWIHKTELSKIRHNAGFNIHVLQPGSVLGAVAELAHSFGWTTWFYRNALEQ